jgi:hypothetical protein
MFMAAILCCTSVQLFLWKWGTPIIMGWFAGQTWTNNSNIPNCLDYYFVFITHIIYKSGWSLHNTTWKSAGWRPMLCWKLHLLLSFFH